MIRSRRTKPRPGRLDAAGIQAQRIRIYTRDIGICEDCGVQTIFNAPEDWDNAFHRAHRKNKRMHGDDDSNVKTSCGKCHRAYHQNGPSGTKPCPPKPKGNQSTGGNTTMTINEMFDTNVERCKRWHPGGIEEWSPLEWAGAMCGEAGEAANAAKKLKRVESHSQNINAPGRSLIDVDAARVKVAEEVADTVLYGLLLMARVGIVDPQRLIAEVFNRKSEEYGFPERMNTR